jgi:hypothetical protein
VSEPRSYRFDPLDHSGVLFGLNAGACAAIGAALVAAVVAVSEGAPLLAAAAAPTLTAVLCVPAPGGGRALWELLPSPLAWRRTRPSRATWLGQLQAAPWASLPSCLAGIDADGAAVRDRRARTTTVVLRAFGPRLGLTDTADHDLGLGLWGDALAQLASDPDVVQVAWTCTTTPARQHHPAQDGDSVYAQVAATVSARAVNHETLLAVTASMGEGAAERAAAAAHRALRGAGIAAEPPLAAADLARLLARRADPFAPTSGPPLAIRNEWMSSRIDGAVHRAWWVAGWPQLPVSAGWIDAFLAAGPATRTLAVVMVPSPAPAARRRIARDLVKLGSDAATKTERGRRVDARQHRVTQTLLDREQELVDGHAEFAYTAVVDVAAPDPAALEAAAAAVEQAAAEAGLELRALHGRHDLGWAATLPFGLAPRMVTA